MYKTIFFFSFCLVLATTSAQSYSKCKISLQQKSILELSNLGIAVDHGTLKENHYFISDFSAQEVLTMENNGFLVETLIEDVTQFYAERSANKTTKRNTSCAAVNQVSIPVNFNLGSMAGFYTYSEFLAELDEMVALYPNLITLKAPISNFLTHENRPIYWLKISDNANQTEAEDQVLYTSIHHAREPNSLTNTIFYMWYLLENYATNPEVKYLVDETEMYFVPIINPDGYIENETQNPNGGGMWRKNKRDNGDGTFGVDLNRNYSNNWGTTGVSFNTANDTYPGSGPFSEPETQAVKWFCENHNFKFAFNAHTYSNLMLFPIGSQINDFAADHDYFQSLANEMVIFNGYVAQKASSLYPASGGSDDYMYLSDLSVKPKIFAYTPEIGSASDGFWPAEIDITSLCQEMLHSNLVLAHAPHNYYKVKETDPSSIVDLVGNFNHDVKRLGLIDGNVNVSIQPLQGIQTTGVAVNHALAINISESGAIPYTLSSTIVNGDEVSYVLISDFGQFIQRDTIYKIFGNPTLQYENSAENTNDWTGNWNTTTEDFVSPSTSFTDSPNSNYSNFTTKTCTFNNAIDLTNSSKSKVSFMAKWDIELEYDYASFEVSIDNGTTWIPQCGKYTNAGTGGNGGVQPEAKPIYDGTQSSWVLEEISLNDYLGETVKIRFTLRSDQGLAADGFYFDDFKIFYTENNASLKVNSLTSFSISPNPAKESIQIRTEKSLLGSTISILDLNGKIILSKEISTFSNFENISLANIEAGHYLIELKTKKGLKDRKKLIIL
jgi:hypothetical protein